MRYVWRGCCYETCVPKVGFKILIEKFIVQDAPHSELRLIVTATPAIQPGLWQIFYKYSNWVLKNYLHQLGDVCRLDAWVPHQLNEANLRLNGFPSVIHCRNMKKVTLFWREWWGMKNRLSITIWSTANCHKQLPKKDFTWGRLCFQFGGCLLWASSQGQDHQSRCTLWPAGHQNHPVLANKDLSSRQCQTAHFL